MRGRRLLLAMVGALTAPHCARPIIPPPAAPPPAVTSPEPQVMRREAEPKRLPIEEEAVGATMEPAAGPETGSEPAPPPAAATAPSVLDTLRPGTPPQVAAATHLAEDARAQLAAGNVDRAMEKLERAIAVDANNPYAYYFLAECHFSRRTYDQAIAFADRAALLSARSDPAWAGRAFFLQGAIYEAAGRFADARAAYGRAAHADPRNAAAVNAMTRMSGGTGPQP